jgi:CBS domain-containing protein
MVHERSRALPVVDDEGQVVALLTDLDALRWVARRSRAP